MPAAESGDDVPETGQDAVYEDAALENALSERAEQDTYREDESAEQTDLQEEQEGPFGSSEVYYEILAEKEEDLSEEERKAFLAGFGFEDSEPFYVHTEEDGYPFMELYFDEEREIGCGIRYGRNDFGNVICGFAFSECTPVSWYARDPFSVLSVYGTSGEESVTDYKENYEYDAEGRLLHFWSTGTPTDIEGWDNIPMIEVEFTYDDQGRLQEKEYSHFTTPHLPFGTTYSYQNSYYDEDGRLQHTMSYVTHGSLEGYYIYQGDSDVPTYYLNLDHMHVSYPTFYRFVSQEDKWGFGGFRSSTKTADQTYEIQPGGETDFLKEQGFTEADLVYEYTWHGDSEFQLSLYCDEEITRGAGLIREYRDGKYADLEIFTFEGCVSYLADAGIERTLVYATYDDGREIHFLQGETIDDHFGAMEPDEMQAVSFDYTDYGKLKHMHQELDHGSVDRFYFYINGHHWPWDSMLEVDHGRGVTLYMFGM